MKKIILSLLSIGLLTFGAEPKLLSVDEMKIAYPTIEKSKKSPGKVKYYIDPIKGSDQNSGRHKNKAWKTFSNINKMVLTAGDQVLIVRPGAFKETLRLRGEGTKRQPIVVKFAPGRYDLYPEKQLRKAFHISNTNDDPYGLKAIGIYIHNAKYVKIMGSDSHFFMRGKMIEVCIDHSKAVSIDGISLDYHRPTVSEYKILKVTDKSVTIKIHKDSTYEIRNGKLVWIGEGWEVSNWYYSQRVNVKGDNVRRSGRMLSTINNNVKEISPFVLEFPLPATKGPRFTVGDTYQARDVRRDCAGIFQERSANIVWKNCEFNYLHGMGVVSQFCENITFSNVRMAPKKGSGRTCAAWADILHFSGCKGQINVFDVFFSGANDDAINVHGTHLRITERIADNKIKVCYIHGQSYGFEQYIPGDKVDFIRTDFMTPYASNQVKSVEKVNDKEIILTLVNPVPNDIKLKLDVIENATWTANLHVNNCIVDRIPTRGFLITTRGKVVVENTVFVNPGVGILCEDDARGWFESGIIRDLTIKNSTFLNCGITFSPKAKAYNNEGVHQNINIVNNQFYVNGGAIVSANYVENMNVTGNTVFTNRKNMSKKSADSMVRINKNNCKTIKVGQNKTVYSENFMQPYLKEVQKQRP